MTRKKMSPPTGLNSRMLRAVLNVVPPSADGLVGCSLWLDPEGVLFMEVTRHWEIEPTFFKVDAALVVVLEGLPPEVCVPGDLGMMPPDRARREERAAGGALVVEARRVDESAVERFLTDFGRAFREQMASSTERSDDWGLRHEASLREAS